MKTKGKCVQCGKLCDASRASAHLLSCVGGHSDHAKANSGYLIKVSWLEQPSLYWMFIALPKSTSLSQLDHFLRKTWLECCGHLSEFTIGDRRYMSHTESGKPSQPMKNKVDQLFTPGLKIRYVYDMGSSTELELKVIGDISAPSQNEITLLMQNDPPSIPCESCKKISEIICALCGATACADCGEEHSCAVDEGDTYMLMPLVNSPRTGVCGYVGSENG